MSVQKLAQRHAHNLIIELQSRFGIKDTMFPMDEQVFDNMVHAAFNAAVVEAMQTCPVCDGDGKMYNDTWQMCEFCHGTGSISREILKQARLWND